jgi:hypothetical protein
MHLYIIQSDVTGAIKVGRANDPEKRIKALQTGASYELKIIRILEGMGDSEFKIHALLKKHKLHLKGEWFHWDSLRYLPDEIILGFNWETEYWWRKNDKTS